MGFIPRAVGLIRSTLSFEKSIIKDTGDTSAEAEDHFFSILDEAFVGCSFLRMAEFKATLEQCDVVNPQELQAVRHLLSAFGDEVPVEDAKSQIWALVKNMRRMKGN